MPLRFLLIVSLFALAACGRAEEPTKADVEQLQREVRAYAERNPQHPWPPEDRTELVIGDLEPSPLPADGTIDVFTGEGAFYLYDRRTLERWTDEDWQEPGDQAAVNGGVGAVRDVLYVTTAQAERTPVRIRVHDRRPRPDRARWDAITEADLDLVTGDLVVMPNGDAQAETIVDLPAGRFRARVSSRATSTTTERLAVDLWPRGARSPVKVLKARAG